MKIHSLLLITFMFFHCSSSPSLLTETLIKTPKGLVAVDNIKIGDVLIGYSKKSLINVSVLGITSNIVEKIIILKTTKGEIHTVSDELFYDPIKNQWIKAQDIIHGTYFLDSQFNHNMCLDIEFITIPPTKAYKIYTTYPHNFFAYNQEILVHNFFPFVGLGASFLFGGGLEFGSLSVITSVASIVFGITLFKKHAKPGGSFHITSTSGYSGPGKDPNDDDKKNQKRKINSLSKSEFFKKIKHRYEYYKNGIYKLKPGAKSIENAEYLQWDHLHSDVEAYSKNKMHLGSIDPETLTLYKVSRSYKI